MGLLTIFHKEIIIIGLIFGLIFILAPAEASNNSLFPIIEGKISAPEVETGETFTLIWIIIDDNPAKYEIFRNNDLLDFGTLESSTIELTRIEPSGTYTFTLKAYDYSNNVQENSLVIVVQSPPTTSIFTVTGTESVTGSSTTEPVAASNGFLFYMTLVTSGFFLIYRKILSSRKE